MDKLFIDTNSILDLLTKRPDFYKDAQFIFSMGDRQDVGLYISSISLANSHYILSKQLGEVEGRRLLRNVKVLVTVLSMDDKIIDRSLNSEFKDFEDAIQYYTAIENSIPILLTRNLKGFKTAKIPVLSVRDYLTRIKAKNT